MTNELITLAHKQDTYNFYQGMPLKWSDNAKADGRLVLVPLTPWERVKDRFTSIWNSCTRWWRPRYIVVSIDHNRGEIRVVRQWWSWARLRWVP